MRSIAALLLTGWALARILGCDGGRPTHCDYCGGTDHGSR